MDVLFPKPLKTGDKVGFFSPSSPATVFAPKRFERAKQFLESKGLVVQAGKLTGKSDFYRSGSIQERVDELNTLIRDPEVRCIISTIGGNNSNALLPYLDYQALKADPKIIIGYSDVTALLLGIHAQTGLTTFYGPALVASFGEFPPLVEETFESFYEICMQPPRLPYQYQMPERWTDVRIDWHTQDEAKPTYENRWDFIGNGVITGRLIGGNLNTIRAIWGSPYMPDIEQGDILLMEDCMHGIEVLERSFAHMKACGVFDKISAIVLGKHELFEDKGTGRTPLDVLLEVLAGKTLPILSGFDSCHTHPMLVTPIGVQATIDFDQETFELISPWIQPVN